MRERCREFRSALFSFSSFFFFLLFAIASRSCLRFYRRCIFVLTFNPRCFYLYPFACSYCFALIRSLFSITIFFFYKLDGSPFWHLNGIFLIPLNSVSIYCYPLFFKRYCYLKIDLFIHIFHLAAIQRDTVLFLMFLFAVDKRGFTRSVDNSRWRSVKKIPIVENGNL